MEPVGIFNENVVFQGSEPVAIVRLPPRFLHIVFKPAPNSLATLTRLKINSGQ